MIHRLFVPALATVTLATAAATLADGPLTPIGDLRRGMPVTVAGTVERIIDEDEFRLADPSGSVLVYVGPNRVPAAVGERVTDHGVVDDDPGPLEIYATRLIRADGTEVRFSHRYD